MASSAAPTGTHPVPSVLLIDKQLSAIQSERISTSICHEISQDALERIRAASHRLGVTTATIFHASVAKVVGCYAAEDEASFGITIVTDAQGVPRRATTCITVSIAPDRFIHEWLADLDGRYSSRSASHGHSNNDAGKISIGASFIDSGQPPCAGDESFDLMDFRFSVGTVSTLSMDVDTARINIRAAHDICDQIEEVMLQIAAPGTGRVGDLSVISGARAERALVTWNATQTPFDEHVTLHGLARQQARLRPHSTAAIGHDGEIDYATLDVRASELAYELVSLGILPGDRVGLCTERSISTVVGMLGIMKAGAAYVPIDPSYPAERVSFMLKDARLAAVVSSGAGSSAAVDTGLPHIVLDAGWHKKQRPASARIDGENVSPGSLAYVIYTSGSSGSPKGVMLDHRGRVNNFLDYRAKLNLSDNDKVICVSSLSFDISVCNIFTAFCSGGCVVFPDPSREKDPDHWMDLILRHGITVWHSAPSLFDALLDVGEERRITHSPLRMALLGGDWIPLNQPERSRQVFSGLRFAVAGGATELSVDSTFFEVGEVNPVWRSIPYGRPMDNQIALILDRHMQLVPVGVPGELYLGGVGVAAGYFDRPALTAEKFVPHPWPDRPGERLYRTGDLARYGEDGLIELLGRIDFQVKIHGVRIELGEIEALLRLHPHVASCVVMSPSVSIGETRQLVAYIVPNDPAALSDTKQLETGLKEWARHKLPAHLIPNSFVFLDCIPLSPNGKVDRRRLSDSGQAQLAPRTYHEPATEMERVLADIWRSLLRIDKISRDAHFFQIGANSLHAVRLRSHIRRAANRDLSIREIFRNPVLSDMAIAVERWNVGNPWAAHDSLQAPSPDEHLPLSFAQERMWFLSQLENAAESYHVRLALRIRGPLKSQALRDAADALMQRHEVLRTHFLQHDGRLGAGILPEGTRVPWTEYAWDAASGVAEHLDQGSLGEWNEPFDLVFGPLLRACLIRISDDDHFFLTIFHHGITDGWSTSIWARELSALYNDPATELPKLELQYTEYARWQRQQLAHEQLEAKLEWWRKTLSNAPPRLNLPTDRPRPSRQSFAGAAVPVHLPLPIARNLKVRAGETGATLFTICLAAWSVVLARLSGEDDIVVGTPLANRNRAELEALIGLFVNSVALRLDLSGNPTWMTLIGRVHETAVHALDHADVPLEQVVEAVAPLRHAGHTPLFQVMFSWENFEDDVYMLQGVEVQKHHSPTVNAKFDLELVLREDSDGGISGELVYATALFDANTAIRYRDYLVTVLREMVVMPDTTVGDVAMQPPAERQLVLEIWNQTQADYPSHSCIHQLFEAQVRQTPDAIALVHRDQTLTYAQLNQRANRLAHHLRELGVRPDDRVAICLERRPAMLVGLLAILKAGGAYVPLDPAYPSERLTRCLVDAAPRLLLCDHAGRQALDGAALADRVVLDMDQPQAWAHGSDIDPDPHAIGLTSRHLAYVIYTSGSTGTPKGVMVEHQSTINFLTSMQQTVDVSADDRLLAVTSISFDIASLEMFLPLMVGARIVLLARHEAIVPLALQQAITRFGISIMQATPSTWRALVDAAWPGSPDLKALCGGESLAPDLAATLKNTCRFLWNVYGPTETTIWSSCFPMAKGLLAPAQCIGRPLANTRMYLLDAQGLPVPLGSVGELYIGGAGVARGYLNQPQLTAERFLDDPFCHEPGARMYRTGDLARYLPDGNLVFLGRNDHQVKVRGFRIELGEVEARLSEHPHVGEAVVIARDGVMGDTRLIAYVVPGHDAPLELAPVLRTHLGSCLPDYMVPSAFVTLPALPLSPNGKLDRRALPIPDDEAFARQAYAPPQGEVETTLAALWQELLGLERVGRHDNFFELGGHSLLAMRMMSRLRSAGFGINVTTLFANPVIANLATLIDKSGEAVSTAIAGRPEANTTELEHASLMEIGSADMDAVAGQIPGGSKNIQDAYPLLPLQSGFLYHHLLSSKGDPYLAVILLALDNKELLDRYTSALQQVVNRHDILRTSFHWEDVSQPVQVVWKHAPLNISRVKLDSSSETTEEQLLRRFNPRQHRIDLNEAPLIRLFVALDEPSGRWYLLQLRHHLISDHSTQDRIDEELIAFLTGETDDLPEPRPFRNVIAHARSATSEQEQTAFFTEMLGDVSEPTLLFGLDDVHLDGCLTRQAHMPLPSMLVDRLRKRARQLGLSLATVFHVAWAAYLASQTRQATVAFGTVLFGRMSNNSEMEQTLGVFINTLPLRVDFDELSLLAQLQLVNMRLARLLRHEHASLTLAQRCSNVPSNRPLFNSLFNYRHNAALPEDSDRPVDEGRYLVDGIEWVTAKERTNYPYILNVEDYGNHMALTIHATEPVHPERIGSDMLRLLENIASALERDDHVSARSITIDFND
jgi:amino acid adenylation domain-containing protein